MRATSLRDKFTLTNEVCNTIITPFQVHFLSPKIDIHVSRISPGEVNEL